MQEVSFLEIMSGIKEIRKMRKCPNGHVVDDNMKFCPVCGTGISAVGLNYCSNCGKDRQATDNFCTYCSFPFVQPLKEEKNDDFSLFWISLD